jgi:hypothetical protein
MLKLGNEKLKIIGVRRFLEEDKLGLGLGLRNRDYCETGHLGTGEINHIHKVKSSKEDMLSQRFPSLVEGLLEPVVVSQVEVGSTLW